MSDFEKIDDITDVAQAELAAVEYEDGFDHLLDELNRLDKILSRRVHLFHLELSETEDFVRAAPNYVTQEEVEYLLQQPRNKDYGENMSEHDDLIASWNNRLLDSIELSEQRGVALPMSILAERFGLGGVEIAIIIICLAPELDRKYDRIYAYLQDDITRKRASIDLVLKILFDNHLDRWRARQFFSASSPLRKHNIIEVIDNMGPVTGSSDLSQFIKLDSRILSFVLGNSQLDKHIEYCLTIEACADSYCPYLVPSHIYHETKSLIENCLNSADKRRVWLSLIGSQDVGKAWFASELARSYGGAMIIIDVKALLAQLEDNPLEVLRKACRESVLLQLPIYLQNGEAIFRSQGTLMPSALIKLVLEYSWLVFCDYEYFDFDGFEQYQAMFHRINFQVANADVRREQWLFMLNELPVNDALSLAEDLGHKYQLLPMQIRTIVDQAMLKYHMSADDALDKETLFAICRTVSSQQIQDLACKVESNYSWNDLVLPKRELSVLQQICQQVSNQFKVFEQWGFNEKFSYGFGLSVLFSGQPGTGKTLACQVIANELNLDLFRVDLSGIVSKYIGETEKNLDKVFAMAKSSSAILFFDEADALFGKRSEVSDAHDRYANIETSYLLQKIEEYAGIVVLATNFRKNIDEAFIRRIRFIVDFPFPDCQQRKNLWQKMIPNEVPIDTDVDFAWLANNMSLSGGSIKNVVLNSAFQAAELNEPLNMGHLQKGCRDEFRKIGRLWDEKAMQFATNLKGN